VTEQTTDQLMDRLRADRALTVVRAERIPDAVELCEALSAGGLGLVELTFTTPDVLSHVGKAAAAGLPIGVGTVMTAEQARGAKYLSDLHGPYPDVELLPSGGISSDNAADYLAAGALAVCAGTSVVPPAAVAAGAWSEITDRARTFAAALRATGEQ
jgi:2-dehydro-3-deoxyphosphogluconate aldolase / (4S)-4-hydroxy-2-oxoglutarate aldolase